MSKHKPFYFTAIIGIIVLPASAQQSQFWQMFANKNSFSPQSTAARAWKTVPGEEQACINSLLSRQNLDVNRLMLKGIQPNDRRLQALRIQCSISAIRANPAASWKTSPVIIASSQVNAAAFPSNNSVYLGRISDPDLALIRSDILNRIQNIPSDNLVYFSSPRTPGGRENIDGKIVRDWNNTAICVVGIEPSYLSLVSKFTNNGLHPSINKVDNLFDALRMGYCLVIATPEEIKTLFLRHEEQAVTSLRTNSLSMYWNDEIKAGEIVERQKERAARVQSVTQNAANLFGMVAVTGNADTHASICVIDDANKDAVLAWFKYDLLAKRADQSLTNLDYEQRSAIDMGMLASGVRMVIVKKDIENVYESMKAGSHGFAGNCSFAIVREDYSNKLFNALARDGARPYRSLDFPFVFSRTDTVEDLKKYQQLILQMEKDRQKQEVAATQAEAAKEADPNYKLEKEAGVTGNYCKIGREALQQTFDMRTRGVPLDQANENIYRSGFGGRFNSFLLLSVNRIYRTPNEMQRAFSDGTWTRTCISVVGGQ